MSDQPLGFITPSQLNADQQDAHDRAVAAFGRFAMAPQTVAKGEKIILTDFLEETEVVADMGGVLFDGFMQLTGSCVGVSAGDAVACLSAVQRMIADAPTKAIVPWWGFIYGVCRRDEGDRGAGAGADDATMGQVLKKGVVDITHPSLKLNFKRDNGWYLDKQTEFWWSNPSNVNSQLVNDARAFPVGTVAPLGSTADIRTAIINGYPVLDGCDNFIGNGSIAGGGGESYARGHYDGRGGHSTCYIAYWEHPNDGPLYGYWNQWATSTYPKDPAGLGRCMVWVLETEVNKLFRTGGDHGQTMALSHLTTFPVQSKILNWLI